MEEWDPFARSAPSDLYASLTESEPDAESQALLRELLRQVEAGKLREPLVTLSAHHKEIGQGHRLLEELFDGIIAVSLGAVDGELPIADYTRRLLYILRAEDRLSVQQASEQSSLDEVTLEDVRIQARVALRRLMSDEPEPKRLEQGARQLIPRALLELIWQEAAERTISRGGSFFVERWLKPDALDYFVELAYGSLKEAPKLTEADLLFAYAGFPNLVASDEEAELLRGRVGQEAILPRLLQRSWPLAADALIAELVADPTLAGSSRSLIVSGLKRLRGIDEES